MGERGIEWTGCRKRIGVPRKCVSGNWWPRRSWMKEMRMDGVARWILANALAAGV